MVICGRKKIRVEKGKTKTLLETIDNEWKQGNFSPLFIFENTTTAKEKAIRNSPYLNFIFEEILPTPEMRKTLVIYGSNFRKEDEHILKKLKENSYLKKIAISVYEDGKEQEFETRVRSQLKCLNKELYFFDADSCWKNGNG